MLHNFYNNDDDDDDDDDEMIIIIVRENSHRCLSIKNVRKGVSTVTPHSANKISYVVLASH